MSRRKKTGDSNPIDMLRHMHVPRAVPVCQLSSWPAHGVFLAEFQFRQIPCYAYQLLTIWHPLSALLFHLPGLATASLAAQQHRTMNTIEATHTWGMRYFKLSHKERKSINPSMLLLDFLSSEKTQSTSSITDLWELSTEISLFPMQTHSA